MSVLSRVRGLIIFPLVFLGCLSLATAQDRKIALTFDDLPALGPLGFWTPREVSNMILRTLEKYHIKAAGFVVEEKIDDDPPSYVVLDDWASRGHILGNQTYADVDFNQLNAEDFLAHVADGQTYLRRVSYAHPFNFRYLRFPFLHYGDTERKKKEVARALYNAGYQVAHVTVKTSDYRFNAIYLENERDAERISRLKSIFLEHAGKSLDYAETQSQKVFDRNITHILWLHCGIVTATFLEDLIELLRARGYQFVSLPEALSDPAFKVEENYAGPEGLSFIDRVAATHGLPFDSSQGELSLVKIEASLGR